MDADELRAEILHQRELQKEYRKHLRVLRQQKARFGDAYVPPHIQVEIDELTDKLELCEQDIMEKKQILVNPLNKQLDKHRIDDQRISKIEGVLDDHRNTLDEMLNTLTLIIRTAVKSHIISYSLLETQENYEKALKIALNGYVTAALDRTQIDEGIKGIEKQISEIENL